MKNTFLASVTFGFLSATASMAAMPVLGIEPTYSAVAQQQLMHLASDGSHDSDDRDDDNDNDDNSDDSSHSGNSRHSSDDDGDRNGNRRSNDDSNNDSSESHSNRTKIRIPGGSGCDDTRDIAEHAECRVQ